MPKTSHTNDERAVRAFFFQLPRCERSSTPSRIIVHAGMRPLTTAALDVQQFANDHVLQPSFTCRDASGRPLTSYLTQAPLNDPLDFTLPNLQN